MQLTYVTLHMLIDVAAYYHDKASESNMAYLKAGVARLRNISLHGWGTKHVMEIGIAANNRNAAIGHCYGHFITALRLFAAMRFSTFK